MNIGVLGGTFDPIHMGHLIIAEETRARLDLVEVLFVPAGQPWLKANNYISPAEHRIQMVRLAIADEPSFRLYRCNIAFSGRHWDYEYYACVCYRAHPRNRLA